LWWFFDGENVVGCVVNVVFWQSLFRGGKMRHVLGFIFRASRFGNSGFGVEGGVRGDYVSSAGCQGRIPQIDCGFLAIVCSLPVLVLGPNGAF
jgi:hypothetical protein